MPKLLKSADFDWIIFKKQKVKVLRHDVWMHTAKLSKFFLEWWLLFVFHSLYEIEN